MFVEKKIFYLFESEELKNFKIIYTKTNFKNISDIKSINISDVKNKLQIKKHKNLYYLEQIHSTKIINIENSNEGCLGKGDGLFTFNEKDILFIRNADCMPIYVIDKVNFKMMLLHSGWQGSYENILEKGIKLFLKNGSNIKNIYVVLGIAAQECCYEISKDFELKFLNKYNYLKSNEIFFNKNGKKYFSNCNFLKSQLLKLNIDEKQIFESKSCTICNEKVHSYRRNKTEKRNGAFLFYTS